jgi:hypothetical protein
MTTAEKREACGYRIVTDKIHIGPMRCYSCLHKMGHAVTRCGKHKMAVRWFAACNDFEKKGGGG